MGHTGLLVYRISQPKRLGKMNLFETEFLRGKSQPITPEMVESAYRKVKSNGGAAGVDGKDMSYMEAHKSEELYKLWNRMASGSYFPLEVTSFLPGMGTGRCSLP
jgi:hypothetical protein